jgi:hypothetical protein
MNTRGMDMLYRHKWLRGGVVRRAKDKGHRLEPQHNRVARAAFQYRKARASGGLPRIETKKIARF